MTKAKPQASPVVRFSDYGTGLGFCFWLFLGVFSAVFRGFRRYRRGAFCICAHAAARGGTPGRPRQVFRFENPAATMRRRSPQTARADDQEEVCHALR